MKFFHLLNKVHSIQQMEEFQNSILHLDDTAVNTESNLRYVILQKNLYKLGIPIDLFVEHKKDIDDLVNRRNGIAHGNAHAGISNMDFLIGKVRFREYYLISHVYYMIMQTIKDI